MRDIPFKVIPLCLHRHLTSYQSSFLLNPGYKQPVNITSRVHFLIHCHDFLAFLSISSNLLIVDFTITVPYLIKETAHVFIVIILSLPLSLLFIIDFVLLEYFIGKFSFIPLSLILLYSKMLDIYTHFPQLP